MPKTKLTKTKSTIILILIAISISLITTAAEGNQEVQEVIVLTYHHLVEGEPENGAELNYQDFAAQMEYLADNDYQVLSEKEFYNYRDKQEFPENSVLLTFDDGYHSFKEYALPVLEEHDFPAVVFPIISSMPGFETRIIFSERLSFSQMRGLLNSELEVTFGSHSYDLHRYKNDVPLIEQQPDEDNDDYHCRLRRDLRLSRDLLEDQLDRQHEIVSLAWPYGYSSDEAREIARELGFELQFKLGDRPYIPGQDDCQIPRLGVISGDLNCFIELLEN